MEAAGTADNGAPTNMMMTMQTAAEAQIEQFGALLEAPADRIPALVDEVLHDGATALESAGRQLEAVRAFLDAPPVTSAKVGLEWFHSREKRQFDIALCEVLVPVFLPVVAAAARAVMLEDGREPFFVQRRIGLDGRSFGMYKIRTMVAADGTGPSRGPDDPRATTVGRILRAAIIDEFPQLWNVYLGDMTWCSTRALVGSEISRSLGAPEEGDLDLTMEQALGPVLYSDWFDGFYKRVLPGLVSPFGSASVRYRERDRGYFHLRWGLDTWYRDHGCLEVDLRHLRIKLDDSLAALRGHLAARDSLLSYVEG